MMPAFISRLVRPVVDVFRPRGKLLSTNYQTGTTALTVVPVAAIRNGVIYGTIAWSYSATPTGGNIAIQDATTVFGSWDVTAGGFQSVDLPPGGLIYGGTGTISIVMAPGGGAVVGRLTFLQG